jgi:hypothetical protein
VFYSGKHFSIRQAIVDQARNLVRAVLDPEVPFVPVPCAVEITCFLGKNIDADNICDKLYIDALKGWWFMEDDRANIQKVSVEVLPQKKGLEDAMIIQAFPLGSGVHPCEDCGAVFVDAPRLWSHRKKVHRSESET